MQQLPDERLRQSFLLEELLQASEATLTYRGRARDTGDEVVAKVLRLAGSGVGEVHRRRFLKAISALIQHGPVGIPPLKDAAWTGDHAVLIFVPVSGIRLTQLLGLTPPQAALLLSRTAWALHSLHEAGVAHLNLAPDNLLVASADRVFLTGLGWGFLRLPTSGAPYAAPELRKAVDLAEPHRCDIFSLASVAAALFDARLTFAEEEATVELPESVRRELAEAESLERFLARCLHEDPFERPTSAGELARVLEAAVPEGKLAEEGTVRLAPETFPTPPPEPQEQPPEPSPSPEVLGESPAMEVTRSSEGAPETAPATEPSKGEAPPPETAPPEAVPPEAAPSAVVPAPPSAAPGAQRPSPAKPGTAAPPGKWRRVWLWVVLAALALAGVVALALLLFAPQPASVARPTPSPVLPTPSPRPTAPEAPSAAQTALEAARQALEAGDLSSARKALEVLRGQTATLEEQTALRELEQKLRQAERDRAWRALRTAWNNADLAGLRRALRELESAGAGEEGLAAEDNQLFARSRMVHQAVSRLAQEEKAQRWEGVLAEARELERLFPGSREVAQAQERAATALERQAQELERQGKLDEALAKLQTLERFAPARPSLTSHLARLRQAKARREELQQLLAKAAAYGREGRPELGLGLLGELPSDLASSVDAEQLRQELAQQLASLDGGTPTVTAPSPGYKWEYAKGQVAKLEVKASDDHGVARVTLFFRKKGEKSYRSLLMSKTSAGTYLGEVVPAAHGNEDLEFYVLAEDHSGHVGSLGTPEKPLEAKRKRGLFGF